MIVEIVLCLVTLILGLILFLRRNYGVLERTGVPVVKPSVFGLGSDPFNIHKTNYINEDMKNFKKYGKIWGSYSTSEPWLNIADPDLIKAITVKNFDNFSSHYFEPTNKKFRNLAEANGAEWRDLRKGLSPTFTSGKIKGMLDLIHGSVDNMVNHLETATRENPSVMVKQTFQAMALDVIAKCAFGIESNSYENPDNEVFKYGKELFEEFVISTMSGTVEMNMFQAWAGIAKLSDITPPSYPHLWQITRSVQKQREASGPGPGDFIDRLNELTKKVNNGEFPSLDPDQVTGQGIAFIAAGFETTSNTLTSLCLSLAKNPAVMETLLREVDTVLEEHDGVVNHETIADMPYLEACIKENLRVHPPITRNDRLCIKDWVDTSGEFGGLEIKKGTHIKLPYHVIHHNPEFWPEPETFKPERFLKANAHNIKPFSWLPFGSGPRQCIGERFAMTEMKIAMVKLLQKFTLETNANSEIKLLDGDMFMYGYPDFSLTFIKRSD